MFFGVPLRASIAVSVQDRSAGVSEVVLESRGSTSLEGCSTSLEDPGSRRLSVYTAIADLGAPLPSPPPDCTLSRSIGSFSGNSIKALMASKVGSDTEAIQAVPQREVDSLPAAPPDELPFMIAFSAGRLSPSQELQETIDLDETRSFEKRATSFVTPRFCCTPEQAKAADIQRAYAKQVAAAAGKKSKRVDAYLDVWAKLGGGALEPLMEHTALIDAEYLVALGDLNGAFPPCQHLPSEAKIGPQDLWRLGGWMLGAGLPVLVLSYAWWDVAHPDPLGEQLRLIAPLLKKMLHYCKSAAGSSKQDKAAAQFWTVGVVIDFISLPQKQDGAFETKEQETRFRKALKDINKWYRHPYTNVVLLDEPPPLGMPSYGNTRPLEKRGWPFFEKQVSSLIKDPGCLLKLNLVEQRIREQLDLPTLLSQLSSGRSVPMSPTTFESTLRSKCQSGELAFTSGADTDIVIKNYERGFVEGFDEYRQVSHKDYIEYTNHSWPDAHVAQLAEMFAYVSTNCCLPSGPIQVFVEEGNGFSKSSLALLQKAGGHHLLVKAGGLFTSFMGTDNVATSAFDTQSVTTSRTQKNVMSSTIALCGSQWKATRLCVSVFAVCVIVAIGMAVGLSVTQDSLASAQNSPMPLLPPYAPPPSSVPSQAQLILSDTAGERRLRASTLESLMSIISLAFLWPLVVSLLPPLVHYARSCILYHGRVGLHNNVLPHHVFDLAKPCNRTCCTAIGGAMACASLPTSILLTFLVLRSQLQASKSPLLDFSTVAAAAFVTFAIASLCVIMYKNGEVNHSPAYSVAVSCGVLALMVFVMMSCIGILETLSGFSDSSCSNSTTNSTVEPSSTLDANTSETSDTLQSNGTLETCVEDKSQQQFFYAWVTLIPMFLCCFLCLQFAQICKTWQSQNAHNQETDKIVETTSQIRLSSACCSCCVGIPAGVCLMYWMASYWPSNETGPPAWPVLWPYLLCLGLLGCSVTAACRCFWFDHHLEVLIHQFELDPEETAAHMNMVKGAAQNMKSQRKVIKMLLLGAGEGGKSTVFKQMKVINKDGYTKAELKQFVGIVHSNALQSMTAMIHSYKKLGKPMPAEVHMLAEEFEERSYSYIFESGSLTPELGALIEALWNTQSMKLQFARRSEFQLQDSAEFYFDNIRRLSDENYLPTTEDVLRSRVRTTGIVQSDFIIKGIEFAMFDVGGQRNERRKWIHCFDNVDGVVFVASLSEFDQVLFENETQNRLDEALDLFKQIVNSKWFKETSMILFLNKKDLFEQKLKDKQFADYVNKNEKRTPYAGANEMQPCAEYTKKLFLEKNGNSEKSIYSHITTAIDTSNVKFVFSAVVSMILEANQKSSGLAC